MKQRKERGMEGLEWCTILRTVIKEVFTCNISSWSRPIVGNGVSHLNIRGKNVPGRRKSKCKSPEAERHLPCLNKRRQPLWPE